MDARLGHEHDQIQATARNFLEDNGGIEYARRQMDDRHDDVVDEVWDEIATLDYTALTIPTEYGGLGEGMVSLSALLEEMGRYALPGPYPETMAFCVPLIQELGNEQQKARYFDAIASGEWKLSFALYDDISEEVPESIRMELDRTDDGFRLSGTKTLVPYGGDVERIVLAVRSKEATAYRGISLFLIDPSEGQVRQLRSLDQTRPMWELEFDDLLVTEDALLGTLHRGGDALSNAVDRFRVATCIMLVGGAHRAVELSSEYGKQRTQFGQPIGRFQAVKHRIAEMWMDTEQARSLSYYAAWALDNEKQEAARAVSSAKAYTAENLVGVFTDDIFNHGGRGFSWDHDGHIYLKQAKAWEHFLGDSEYHLRRIADIRDYPNQSLPDYPNTDIPPYR